MKIKPRDVVSYEFIGLEIEVIDAKNKGSIGLKGKVVDETRNTIKIMAKNKEKTLIKNNITIQTKIKGKTYQINGKKLIGRSEERLKKNRK